VIPNIFSGVRDGINMKLCDISSFSFITDTWTTNVSSDSLLSFAAHWIANDFQKLSAVLNVKLLEGNHTGAHLCEQYNEIWPVGTLKKAGCILFYETMRRIWRKA